MSETCRGCGAPLNAPDSLEDGLCGSAVDASYAGNCYDRFTRYATSKGVDPRYRLPASNLHVIDWTRADVTVLWDEWEAAGFPSVKPPDFSNSRTAKELPF